MQFITYKTCSEPEQASAFATVLQENGIEYALSEDRVNLDSMYGDKQFRQQYYVKIKQADFEKADRVLLNLSYQQLNTVEQDHYLFSFTNEELSDILAKPDEWNEFDFLLAIKILKDRGEAVNADEIKKLKQQRIEELARPEVNHPGWVIGGYVSAIVGGLLSFMAGDLRSFATGLFSIFIGIHLTTFKKTLPNGERVYNFSTKDRMHGYIIFVIEMIITIFWIVRFAETGF